jgi:hypothetical protein
VLNRNPVLLDELHVPSVRETMGRLFSTAQGVDLAIARVRLAAVDLRADEISSLQRCRLLLSTVDANLLHDSSGQTSPERRKTVERLIAWAGSGRLELRSCGILAWSPDFSIYHHDAGARSVALVGAHYFQSMFSGHGTALTCVIRQQAAVRHAAGRFEELWSSGYDVLPVVVDALTQSLNDSIPPGAAAPSRLRDPASLVR